MIALPGELSSPLPTNVSALTPNAQARQRLGEIADNESTCLQGGTTAPTYPPSPLVDAPPPLQSSNSFFTQWGMPPLKRGMSLQDTREAAATYAALTMQTQTPLEHLVDESHESPSFLDSFLV